MVFACALSNVSTLFQNGQFQHTFTTIFVAIATVKVKLIPDFYTWAFVLINTEEELVKGILLCDLIGDGGGVKSPLVHVAL